MRTLTVISGPGAGMSLEVEDELVIGRENADLTIQDPELSRRHVAVRPLERGIAIEDLGSLNGTRVNGLRIESETTLEESGTLNVGASEIAIELSFPPPAPEIPMPDVTVQRRVPPPFSPDVTVQREVLRPPPAPDVTVQRETPPQSAPPARDELAPTSVRPVAPGAPEPGGAPPGPGVPPQGPPPGVGGPGAPGRPPLIARLGPWVIVAGAVLVAAIVVLVVVLVA